MKGRFQNLEGNTLGFFATLKEGSKYELKMAERFKSEKEVSKLKRGFQN